MLLVIIILKILFSLLSCTLKGSNGSCTLSLQLHCLLASAVHDTPSLTERDIVKR